MLRILEAGRIGPLQTHPTLLVMVDGFEAARLESFADSDELYLSLHALIMGLIDRGLEIEGSGRGK